MAGDTESPGMRDDRERRGYSAAVRLWGAFLPALIVMTVLVLAGALLIVLIPLGLVLVLAVAAARWGRTLRGPNGPFDGRRNVRVILPRSGPDGAAQR